jgi:hypothetical protein
VSPPLAALADFPHLCLARWRRIDAPGREEAAIERSAEGWRLTGDLHVEEADRTARFRYAIGCDTEWRTRWALVEGSAGDLWLRYELRTDREGRWTNHGEPIPALSGTVDIDLGFTPATNLLPIRRLSLSVAETAPVRSAWLRFPELRLEPLEQTYTRERERVYRYSAMVDGEPFVARLDTDPRGLVVRYEGLWELEATSPAL